MCHIDKLAIIFHPPTRDETLRRWHSPSRGSEPRIKNHVLGMLFYRFNEDIATDQLLNRVLTQPVQEDMAFSSNGQTTKPEATDG